MAELSVPQVDFSSLGQLPQLYKQGQADALRQQTLASLGQGGQADAAALLKSGDLSLAQLGINMQNRETEQARQARQDAFQREESARAQRNADRSYGLQARAAERADDVTPKGFQKQADGSYVPLPGGPADPAYQARVAVESGNASAAQRAAVAEQYGIERGTPEFKAWVVGGKLPDSIANGGTPEVGLNPAYGVDGTGKPAAIQFSKSGKAVQTQLPDGFSLSKEPIRADLGTHIQLIDPITRQPIGNPIPKDIVGVERAKEVGSAQGTAEVALPQVLANSEQVLKIIDQVKNHPGKQYGLGVWSKAPTIPGTPQADFRAAADQLKGQTFLQAYGTLKGGGAITDIEGAKAENALLRAQQAQSQKAYDEALDDFRTVVVGGIARAKAKAGSGAATAPPSQAIRLKFNPATGALE